MRLSQRMIGALLALVACGDGAKDGEAPPDGGPKGACGEVTEWDVTLRGQVHRDGAPVEGAEVALEEQQWHTGGRTYGTATTDAQGRFEIPAEGIVSVEDCWGSAVSYFVYANLDGESAQRGVNSPLFGAIEDGSGQADISAVPLDLK